MWHHIPTHPPTTQSISISVKHKRSFAKERKTFLPPTWFLFIITMKNYYLFSWAFVSSLARLFFNYERSARKRRNNKRGNCTFTLSWNGNEIFDSVEKAEMKPISSCSVHEYFVAPKKKWTLIRRFSLTPPDLTQLIRNAQNWLVFCRLIRKTETFATFTTQNDS